MSKTYRRTSGNQWWLQKPWKGADWVAKVVRDGHWKDGLAKNVKDHTKALRRADEREMISRVFKVVDLDDFDYINLEKKYLGIIWIYD